MTQDPPATAVPERRGDRSGHHEVVVVGGGAAGLSAALTLARARRGVVVIDAGAPGNAAAEGVHCCLGNEGVPPHRLLAAGRAEVRRYGGRIRPGTAVTAHRTAEGFRVALDDATAVTGSRLLLAVGLREELPAVPGLAGQWGRSVVTCPHCHGWELRDRAIGVLACGMDDVEMALTWRQWSADTTLFRHTAPRPGPREERLLAARAVAVVDGEVTAAETAAGRLTGVRLADGTLRPLDALVVTTRCTAPAALLSGLGLTPRHLRVGDRTVGTCLEADAKGRTRAPGVWAAGTLTAPSAKVVEAAAAGVRAAIDLNKDLVHADTH